MQPSPTAAAGQPAQPRHPAPSLWPQAQPTDEPVLRNSSWLAIRSWGRGTWLVAVFADDGRIVSNCDYAVDDFGGLAPIAGSVADANYEHWFSTFAIDQAATDWWLQACDDAGHARQQRQDEHRTRDLLRPPPVTVEVITEPEHPLCVASIAVGDDPRLDAPLYSIHVRGEDPLLVTHAQLAALMLGAQQLCKAASRPAGARVQ